MAIPGIAAGILDAGVQVWSANQSARAQKEANKTNVKIARENTAFQERMANTSHQREVADLKAAGLNPLLSAGGSGASTPSGTTTTVAPENASAGIGDALRGSINTAVTAANIRRDLQQKDANLALTKAQEYAADAGRFVNEANATRIAHQNVSTARTQRERDEASNANSRAVVNEAKTREAQSELNRRRAEFDIKMQKFDSIHNRIKSGLGTVNSAVDLIKPTGSSSSGRGYTDEFYNSQGEHTHSRSRRYEN